MENVILFDIDRTLFDTDSYKEFVYETLASYATLLEKEAVKRDMRIVYQRLRSPLGSFDPWGFIKELSENVQFSVDEEKLLELIAHPDLFDKFIYPEAKRVLEILDNNNITLGIFSNGHPEFQRAKIGSVIEFFNDDHIYIYPYKKDKIGSIIENFPDSKVYIIDDLVEILYTARHENPAVVTILSDRNKTTKLENTFTPDFIIMELGEILSDLQIGSR